MNGCQHENKSFSVAVTDDRGKDFCERCLIAIEDTIYKARGLKMCHKCFDEVIPSKEIGLCKVDAFSEVFDKDLQASYSSLHEKQTIMKKKGICYAEDLKQNRDIRKEAEFKLGPQGNRKMGEKRWV